MLQTSRRSLITGLVSFLAAPAVVRAASLMPVKALPKSSWGLERLLAESLLDNYLGIQRCDYAGYRFWVTGKDNIIHYEPISNEQFYVTGYDILDK